MKVKRITCFECLKCKTIYPTKSEAINCNCEKRCSSNINGLHSWTYLYSFRGFAFYKCKDCGRELTGVTSKDKRKDPLDEIFVKKHKTTDNQDCTNCGYPKYNHRGEKGYMETYYPICCSEFKPSSDKRGDGVGSNPTPRTSGNQNYTKDELYDNPEGSDKGDEKCKR